MAFEAGKGSKPRPLSVTTERFNNNWDAIFGNKMKKSSKPVKLENRLNQEVWLCEDFSNVTLIDGVEYVKVYKPETPNRTHMMSKEALRKLSNS